MAAVSPNHHVAGTHPDQTDHLSSAEKAKLLRDVDNIIEVSKLATHETWLAQISGERPFKVMERSDLTQQ